MISTEERGCTTRRYRRGGGVRDLGANHGTGRTTGTLHFENSRPINRVLSGLRCLGESPRCDGSCCGAPGRYDVRREKITLRGARRFTKCSRGAFVNSRRWPLIASNLPFFLPSFLDDIQDTRVFTSYTRPYTTSILVSFDHFDHPTSSSTPPPQQASPSPRRAVNILETPHPQLH